MRRKDEGEQGEEAERRLAEEAEEYELSKRKKKDDDKEIKDLINAVMDEALENIYAEGMANVIDFYDWLRQGVEKGWVSVPYCETHEGAPMSDQEMEDWDDGNDPCIFSIRIWHD